MPASIFRIAAAAAAAGLCLQGSAWSGPLRVVTTTSDLASITRSLAGPAATVDSLASPLQNAHSVEAKPSLIVKVMKADLFIQTGLELEIAWAPLLVQSSGNKRVQAGSPGFLDASQAIEPMDVPQNPSRAQGDVHPLGNPHYLGDPENAKPVARLIAGRLAALVPSETAAFQERLRQFESDLDRGLAEWRRALEPHRGGKFVSYHKDAAYFARRFGLLSAGEIEPKPGIPPTAAHTARLIARMRAEGVRLILTELWYEARTPQSIAKAAGASVVVRASSPGAVPAAPDYISTMNYNVQRIAQALEGK